METPRATNPAPRPCAGSTATTAQGRGHDGEQRAFGQAHMPADPAGHDLKNRSLGEQGSEREAHWQGESGEQLQAERPSARRPRNRPGSSLHSSLHSSLNSGIEIGAHLPDRRRVASADWGLRRFSVCQQKFLRNSGVAPQSLFCRQAPRLPRQHQAGGIHTAF
jgi:hypothetical protein